MDNFTVTFEYSVAEAVEFQVEYLRSTREGASWRRRDLWTYAASIMLTVACLSVFVSKDRSVSGIVGLLAIAVVVALVTTPLYGRYRDHLVNKRLRRLMTEQLGGPGPHQCSIEIRPGGLWVSQPGIEYNFPWSDARSVEDAPDGITITFAKGRVLARSRGFASDAHRSAFLEGARNHVAGANTSGPTAA